MRRSGSMCLLSFIHRMTMITWKTVIGFVLFLGFSYLHFTVSLRYGVFFPFPLLGSKTYIYGVVFVNSLVQCGLIMLGVYQLRRLVLHGVDNVPHYIYLIFLIAGCVILVDVATVINYVSIHYW